MSNQNTQNKEQFNEMDAIEFINSSPLELFDGVMVGLGLMPEKNPESLNTLLKIAFFSGMLARQAVIIEIAKLPVTEEESVSMQEKAEDDLVGFCAPFVEYYKENPDVVYALLKGSKSKSPTTKDKVTTFNVQVNVSDEGVLAMNRGLTNLGYVTINDYIQSRVNSEVQYLIRETLQEKQIEEKRSFEAKILENLSVAMGGISASLEKLAPVEVELSETRSVGEVLFPGE